MSIGVKDADVGAGADRQVTTLGDAGDLRGLGGDAGECVEEWQIVLGSPFESERQQEFEAGGAGLGFAERGLLGVVVYRCVVGADGVDASVGQPLGQRNAVALAA